MKRLYKFLYYLFGITLPFLLSYSLKANSCNSESYNLIFYFAILITSTYLTEKYLYSLGLKNLRGWLTTTLMIIWWFQLAAFYMGEPYMCSN